MQLWLRILLLVIVVLSVSSFVWFLLGSTAYFQRGMDIIGTTNLWGGGIPVLLFAVLFTVLLIKGWAPTSGLDYVGICIVIVLATALSAGLIKSVSTNGWADEKIKSDSIQITDDKKYEYRIELINLFQRNSHARLYLKDVGTEVETYIPMEIQTRKIVVLRESQVNHWVELEAIDNASHYILYTTKDLGIPEEKFKIDITAGTSSRVN
ncbi:copper transporter family protein [Paenibacillus donghaensis]|uniref:Uncharacterized protein n=1 Tax=Paenibacillus donghaensis TaxID=414771 RepID=A0A2Z2KG72_9BACL|nr:copper transporter family protein [Paenibacillus donghaensis]ASA19812.1 hypothetical protein B9T62_02710 [Paenibacillus donghaensis]